VEVPKLDLVQDSCKQVSKQGQHYLYFRYEDTFIWVSYKACLLSGSGYLVKLSLLKCVDTNVILMIYNA